jgi:hypothetical protein
MKFLVLWATQKYIFFYKICRFEIYILRSRCLSFLCSPKYKVFEQDFLHVGGINSWLHANIFFSFF